MKTDGNQSVKDAETFLYELGRGIPDDERVMVGYAPEATASVDATGRRGHRGWWPSPYRPGKYLNARSNAYVCVSSSIRTPHPTKPGVTRFWRGEQSFGHGLCLLVDDLGNGAGSKGSLTVEAISSLLPPTAVIETSPGNYQAFYFFDQPEPDIKRFKAFICGFVDNVLKDRGGDITVRDSSRYGRMPAGLNNKRVSSVEGAPLKYADQSGNPWQVRLAAADYTRRYTIDQIALAFGFAVTLPRQRKTDPVDYDMLAIDEYWFQMAVFILNKVRMGESSNGQLNENGGKFRISCPWGNEHSNGDVYGAYFRGPFQGANHAYVFGCQHDACKRNQRTWSAFVETVVMPSIIDLVEAANIACAGSEDFYLDSINSN